MTYVRNAPGVVPGSNRQCMKPIMNPTIFRIRVRLRRLPNPSDILKRNKLDDIPALHLALALFLTIYLSYAPNHSAPLCLDRIHSVIVGSFSLSSSPPLVALHLRHLAFHPAQLLLRLPSLPSTTPSASKRDMRMRSARRALADRFEILVCAFFGGALGEVPDGVVPERNSVKYKITHHSYPVIRTQHHIRQNLSLRRQRLTSSTQAAFTFLLCTCRRHLPFKPLMSGRDGCESRTSDRHGL
jgi:hypothetical protein